MVSSSSSFLSHGWNRTTFTQGTVVADIATSRAEIESARLLVLSAALQVIQAPCLLL